jgi:hypothetical protein
MTTPPTIQQEWAQVVYNTLVTNILIPAHHVHPNPQPTIVTFGYGPAGRRTRAPYRIYLKDDSNGIAQHTIFLSPHAWTKDTAVIDLLVQAAITLNTMERCTAVWGYGPKRLANRIQANISYLTMDRDAKRKITDLPMFLPPFPTANFDPTYDKQPTRLKKYTCGCRRPTPRVSDQWWDATCNKCNAPYRMECTDSGCHRRVENVGDLRCLRCLERKEEI